MTAIWYQQLHPATNTDWTTTTAALVNGGSIRTSIQPGMLLVSLQVHHRCVPRLRPCSQVRRWYPCKSTIAMSLGYVHTARYVVGIPASPPSLCPYATSMQPGTSLLSLQVHHRYVPRLRPYSQVCCWYPCKSTHRCVPTLRPGMSSVSLQVSASLCP